MRKHRYLAPWLLIEQSVVAFQDYHLRGGRNLDITLHWILRSVVEVRKSYALRWVHSACDFRLPELSDRCNEGSCVECERCSTTAKGFGRIGKRFQLRFGVMEPVLE
jgi:hypothetical protein